MTPMAVYVWTDHSINGRPWPLKYAFEYNQLWWNCARRETGLRRNGGVISEKSRIRLLHYVHSGGVLNKGQLHNR